MKFQPGLEGLRGVAVLAVLLFHAGYAWMQGGFLGVSTFFTLSGYLITRSLLEERAEGRRVDLPAFWIRRIRRLMPAMCAALLLVAAFTETSAHVTQRMRVTQDGWAALAYLSNWWFIATDSNYAGLLGYPSPVQHFWSLSIEEQFYFVYPLLLLALLGAARSSRRTVGAILGLLVCASWIWIAWLAADGASTERIYYGTDTRSGELLAGCALALLFPGGGVRANAVWRRGLGVVGVLGAAISVGFWVTARVDSDALYAGGLQLYTLASVMLIASAAHATGPLTTLLSSRPIRWLGRISYGAYIYHWPLYLWLDESTSLVGPALVGVQLALTLAVAQASHTWLEEPIRTGRRLPGRRVVPIAAVCMLGVAGVLAMATRGIEPSHSLASAFVRRAPMPEARDDGRIRIMVVGDSIAKQFATGLEDWAERSGKAVVIDAAIRGCGLARGARTNPDSRSGQACDDWQRLYLDKLDAYRPDIVLIYVAGWDLIQRRRPEWDGKKGIHAPEFVRWLESEYVAATEFFGSRGAHIVWVSPLCVAPLGRIPGGMKSPLRRRLREAVIEPLAASMPARITLLDLDAEVCPDGEFTNQHAGIAPFRPDGNHFSDRGRGWVGEWLGGRVLDAYRRVAAEDASAGRP